MSATSAPEQAAVLVTRSLCAGYGRIPVVNDLDLSVAAGEVVALLGPNGAGKSTTMKTIAGCLSPLSGSIVLDGKPCRDSIQRRARRGLAYISETRSVFRGLTTAENLRLVKNGVERGLAYVPELEPLLSRKAGLLSGGEQQLLALARALATRPRLLMIDEVSLGLAPLVVNRLMQAVRGAADEGAAVLIVEQYAQRALDVADHIHVMRRGRIALSGTPERMRASLADIEGLYLSADSVSHLNEDEHSSATGQPEIASQRDSGPGADRGPR
jgi:branched-chain amino acid transport system ATP-binding protein